MISRAYYYSSALKMFFDYPMLGVGLGNFGVNLKYYMGEKYIPIDKRYTAINKKISSIQY